MSTRKIVFAVVTLGAILLMPLHAAEKPDARPTCCAKQAYCCSVKAKCCRKTHQEEVVFIAIDKNDVARPTCCDKQAYCCTVKSRCCGK